MYCVLCEYVKEYKDKDPKNVWDGNVPANYRTNDDPPRALGRWINRQRSNYVKKKIKKDHINKLNKLGLKWAVHDRSRYIYTEPCANTPQVPKTIPIKPAVVSDSRTASLNAEKTFSATKTNAGDAPGPATGRFTEKMNASNSNAVVSDSSAAAALSVSKDMVKEAKVAAK
jgi:hypothetical protein